MEKLQQLKQRIKEVIIGQAAVQRCNATVTFDSKDRLFFPPTVNDDSLHKLFHRVAGDMQPLMGSEDFSFFQEIIPGYFFFLGMKDETMEPHTFAHPPYFRINEAALPFGVLVPHFMHLWLLDTLRRTRPEQPRIMDTITMSCDARFYQFTASESKSI